MRLTPLHALLLAGLVLAPITPVLAQPLQATEDPVCHRAGSLPARSCEAWTARYDGTGAWYDTPQDILVSPDGSKVHVVASSVGPGTARDAVVVSYEADTGEQRWVYRYDGAEAYDVPSQATVGSDGSIYVAVASENEAGDEDYVILALDPDTGMETWLLRYDGPATDSDAFTFHDLPWALELAPDGSQLFVTGVVRTLQASYTIGTLALDPATGTVDWARFHAVDGDAFGRALAVGPDGERVFVAGEMDGGQAIVAYDATTGETLWVLEDTVPSGLMSVAEVTVDPSGETVFVVSARQDVAAGQGLRYRVHALETSTGAVHWVKEGPEGTPVGAVLDATGSTLFVAGTTASIDEGAIVTDFAALAYDTGTGEQRWTTTYQGPYEFDTAADVALTPDGSALFLIGTSTSIVLRDSDAVTIELDAATGELAWATRYIGKNANANHGLSQDGGRALVASPTGDRVFTALASDNLSGTWDLVTAAYELD